MCRCALGTPPRRAARQLLTMGALVAPIAPMSAAGTAVAPSRALAAALRARCWRRQKGWRRPRARGRPPGVGQRRLV
eukprot:10631216-Alexandrium_andersonii.AAC.1